MEQKEQKQVVGIFYINDVRKWEKKRKLGCHLMLDHNPIIIIIIGVLSVFVCLFVCLFFDVQGVSGSALCKIMSEFCCVLAVLNEGGQPLKRGFSVSQLVPDALLPIMAPQQSQCARKNLGLEQIIHDSWDCIVRTMQTAHAWYCVLEGRELVGEDPSTSNCFH